MGHVGCQRPRRRRRGRHSTVGSSVGVSVSLHYQYILYFAQPRQIMADAPPAPGTHRMNEWFFVLDAISYYWKVRCHTQRPTQRVTEVQSCALGEQQSNGDSFGP